MRASRVRWRYFCAAIGAVLLLLTGCKTGRGPSFDPYADGSTSDAEFAKSDHVHPDDWTNPTPDGRYNLVVIGGGTAGLVSAVGAAGLGAKVALIERHLMGGDCLNVGCVPSKGLISAADATPVGEGEG